LRVIAIAFLTAIAGGILSVVASVYLTELYHVSNFEGGRGMLIFFALAPLGFIVGFIIGLIVALRSRGTGFGGFAKAQGIALGIAIGLAAVVSGILYLAADHPPNFDGKSLAIEFELKIPPTLKLPPQPGEQMLHASLYANNRDNRYAELDYDKITTRDGYVFVPGKASLLSQTFNRDLFVSIEGEGRRRSVYQAQATGETAQGRRSAVGLDNGHGTRRSYSGARTRKNRGALSGTAGIVAQPSWRWRQRASCPLIIGPSSPSWRGVPRALSMLLLYS
jgi:hypothetical protein